MIKDLYAENKKPLNEVNIKIEKLVKLKKDLKLKVFAGKENEFFEWFEKSFLADVKRKKNE